MLQGGFWETPYFLFDYGMGELELHDAAPNGLYNLLVEGVPPGKQQVLTMPKSSNASYWYTSDGTTTVRAAIALAYALGGNMFTPWDIYLPVPAAEYTEKTGRYYGQPEQYVDLFAFVRGGAKALLEEGEELAKPLPLALSMSQQPSAANFKLEYTGVNGSKMGKRYRFVGELCPECGGTRIPGETIAANSLLECEAACDAAVAKNASACLGVFYDGAECSVLPKLVVTSTSMRGVSYKRTGPPSKPPHSPPDDDGSKELLWTSDPAVIALGRKAVGDTSRLLIHLVDTRGLPSVVSSGQKPLQLQLLLSNRLAGHAGNCPTSLHAFHPDAPAEGVEVNGSGCSAGDNVTQFALAAPTPWAVVVAAWSAPGSRRVKTDDRARSPPQQPPPPQPPPFLKSGLSFRSADTALHGLFQAGESCEAANRYPFRNESFEVLIEGAEYRSAWLETQPSGWQCAPSALSSAEPSDVASQWAGRCTPPATPGLLTTTS